MGIEMIQSNQNNPEKYKMGEFALSPERLTVLHRGPHLACRHLFASHLQCLRAEHHKSKQRWAIVVHAFNPSTLEAEASGSL